MLLIRVKKQTSKNVADTTFKGSCVKRSLKKSACWLWHTLIVLVLHIQYNQLVSKLSLPSKLCLILYKNKRVWNLFPGQTFYSIFWWFFFLRNITRTEQISLPNCASFISYLVKCISKIEMSQEQKFLQQNRKYFS